MSESRSRMISFRLSPEEYEKFRELCLRNGVRSFSEMARAAISTMLSQPALAPNTALESRLHDVEARLQLLITEVKRLNQEMASVSSQASTRAASASGSE